MQKFPFGVFFLLFLAACVPVGRDFPTYPVSDIKANVTTKSQIFAAFGEPQQRGLDTGRETWTYRYGVYSPLGIQSQKELHVVFNENGTVRNYFFTEQ